MFLLHITERVKIVKSPFLAFFHCEVTENGCVMNVTVWQISWRQHGGPPWETEAGGSQVWIQLGQLSNLVRPCLRIKRCGWRCSSVQRPCIQPLLPEEKKRKIFKKIWKAQGLWGPRRLNSVSSGSTVSRKYPYPPVCVPAGTGVTRPRCLSRCWWESWCRWPTLTPTWACHPWPREGPCLPAVWKVGGKRRANVPGCRDVVTPSAQPCQALPEFVLELLCPRAATAAGAAAVERRSPEGKRSGPAPATSPRPRLCTELRRWEGPGHWGYRARTDSELRSGCCYMPECLFGSFYSQNFKLHY